jgi:hypothetical protein
MAAKGRSRTSKRDDRVDAIRLLKQDHDEVRSLFKRFDAAGDRAHKTKEKIVRTLIEELAKHAAIEEQIFYPAARNLMDDDDIVLESLEEHHIPKIRKALSPADLRDLGEQMAKAKEVAPTHPHPRAPDEPPGNLVAGAAAAVVDRGRDLVRDVIGGKGKRKSA